jgi:hypothetical protein
MADIWQLSHGGYQWQDFDFPPWPILCRTAAPHVNRYGGLLAFAIDKTGYKKYTDFR